MVLGLYYLTYSHDDVAELDPGEARAEGRIRSRTAQEAELAFENGSSSCTTTPSTGGRGPSTS